jgi:hypothetical protein
VTAICALQGSFRQLAANIGKATEMATDAITTGTEIGATGTTTEDMTRGITETG